MVSRTIVLVSLGIAAVLLGEASASAQLDLTPRIESYVMDGVKMSQLTFEAGSGKKAIYQLPRDWNYSGSEDHLDLVPPDLTQGRAKIAKLSGPALSFDEKGRELLKQRTLESLPSGSEEVKIESEAINPLQIDGKQTYLVEVSYVFYGERVACYCLYLDRKPTAMSFRLNCRQKDYSKLRDTFQRSLYSWQNL